MADRAHQADRAAHFAPLLVVLSLLGGVASTAWRAGTVVHAHGYAAWPPSANTLAVLADAARHGLLLSLAAAVALLLLLAASSRRPRPARAFAIGAGALASLAWLLPVAYELNRYGFTSRWRSPGPAGLPAALGDGQVWRANLLLAGQALLAGFVLALLLRWLLSRSRRPRVGPGWGRVFAPALLLLLGGLALRPPLAAPPTPRPPDILLVSLDAVRADHLGCYGQARGLTPGLDGFAARSAVRFESAYCQEPWTLTSHMTMLTGLYADVHGLDEQSSLPPGIWTLPEQLREAGYRTFGSAYDCFWMSSRFGYADGFDEYHVDDRPAAERCDEAARWLLEPGDRPSFAFVHLYDPHSDTGKLPYEAPDPFLEEHAPGATRGWADWTGPGGASASLAAVNRGERVLPDTLATRLRGLYGAGLAATDAAVGELLQRLREAGRLRDMLVVVTADHGEALGERAHFMHEEMMEATLRVPLLVQWPGAPRAGQADSSLAEGVDILPTVLAAAGLEPRGPQQGRDLAGPAPRELAMHRSAPRYAVSTADGWRLHYELGELGPRFLALRRYGPTVGPADGPDQLADSLAVVDRWLEPITSRHAADRLLRQRWEGGAVRMGEADEELLRSLGYIQ